MGGVMKRLLLFVCVFLVVDRFMSYKISQARRYARIEFLRKKKMGRPSGLDGKQLAQMRKAWESVFGQIGKGSTATS